MGDQPAAAAGAGGVLQVVNLGAQLTRPTLSGMTVHAYAEFRASYRTYLQHCQSRQMQPDPVRECFLDDTVAA